MIYNKVISDFLKGRGSSVNLKSVTKGNPILNQMFATIPNHIEERCVVKHFESHTIFLRKEEEIQNIYFVCSGIIRVINEFSNGTIYGFAYVEPGDVTGAMELLSDHKISACSLETLTDCTVISMSVNDFMNWFETDHSFAKAIARMVARKFFPTSYDYGVVFKEEAAKAVALYVFKSVKGTIETQDHILIRVTRQYLSEELGVSIRTVYRALKKLRDLKCLTIENGVICVDRNQFIELRNYLER